MEKQSNKKLPTYSKGEERFNYISHIVGASFGLFVLIYGIIASCIQFDGYKVASMIIYGLSILILYLMSTLYHALPTGKGKKVFRIFDHCTIFLLIAGSYTPFCLVTLRNVGIWGWLIFGVEWGLAVIGIALNGVNMHWKAVKIFSYVAYVVMGWAILMCAGALYKAIGLVGFLLLLIGGLMYTIGIIYFALGKTRKYHHSVWHLFCIAGTILQFVSVALYVL